MIARLIADGLDILIDERSKVVALVKRGYKVLDQLTPMLWTSFNTATAPPRACIGLGDGATWLPINVVKNTMWTVSEHLAWPHFFIENSVAQLPVRTRALMNSACVCQALN